MCFETTLLQRIGTFLLAWSPIKNSLLRNNRNVLAEEENVSRIQKLYFAYKKKKRERELKASFFEHFNPPAIEIIKPDRNTVAKQWNHWKKKGRKHENTFKMMKNILKIEKNYENKIFNSSIVKLNK